MKTAKYKTGALSPDLLDKHVGQYLSKLTEPKLMAVGSAFPAMDNWLEKFIVFAIVSDFYNKDAIPVGIALLRRTHSAIEAYDNACVALGNYVRNKGLTTEYFRALDSIEIAVTMLYQGYDFARNALGKNFFKPGDGSPLNRLNEIYNHSRHTNVMKLPPGHLHPLWLQNDGIYASKFFLKYDEFEAILKQLGDISDQVAAGKRK